MKRKRIAILFGGCSSEYEVSLQSAYAVATHIDKEKYEVLYIGIEKTGAWYLFQGDPADIPGDAWRMRRIVFLWRCRRIKRFMAFFC